eukprot:TRINITY_DN58467_c0_g1_i1.p1 TRINITY_DN58467_c0_g1~~TRINITY_DN58467_c0_g1_i1.p1  ORF type:complete len:100 (+),score=10.45 TRINITY_DN58467_c0_g1_i1:280-579(+)
MPVPLLTIRSAQMSVFRKEKHRRFRDELRDRIAREYPQIDPGDVRVEKALRRAAKYGLRAEEDLDWFVDLDLQRGAEWERQPEMDWGHPLVSNLCLFRY